MAIKISNKSERIFARRHACSLLSVLDWRSSSSARSIGRDHSTRQSSVHASSRRDTTEVALISNYNSPIVN